MADLEHSMFYGRTIRLSPWDLLRMLFGRVIVLGSIGPENRVVLSPYRWPRRPV